MRAMVFGVCVESDCDSMKGSGVRLGLHTVRREGGGGGGGGCWEIKREPWLKTPGSSKREGGISGRRPERN